MNNPFYSRTQNTDKIQTVILYIQLRSITFILKVSFHEIYVLLCYLGAVLHIYIGILSEVNIQMFWYTCVESHHQ